MKRFFTPEWQGIYLGIFSAICFALMGIIIKLTNARFEFQPMELVFWRNFPALIILTALAIYRKQSIKTQYFYNHLQRSGANVIAVILFFYAISLLPLSTAVSISYTSSLSLALLSFLVLGEKISRTTLSALILGIAGVVLLLRPQFFGLAQLGILCALGSSLVAGWAYLQLRELGQLGEPSWRIVFYVALICTLVSGGLSTILGWHKPPPASWVYLLAIAGSAFCAQLALTRAYAIGRKFTISALSYLTVVFSGIFAHFYFKEALDFGEIIAIMMIVGAGILSALPPKIKE